MPTPYTPACGTLEQGSISPCSLYPYPRHASLRAADDVMMQAELMSQLASTHCLLERWRAGADVQRQNLNRREKRERERDMQRQTQLHTQQKIQTDARTHSLSHVCWLRVTQKHTETERENARAARAADIQIAPSSVMMLLGVFGVASTSVFATREPRHRTRAVVRTPDAPHPSPPRSTPLENQTLSTPATLAGLVRVCVGDRCGERC